MTGGRRPFAWSEPQITTTQVYQRGVTFPLIPGVFASALGGIHCPGARAPSPRPGDPSRRAWSPATAVDPHFDPCDLPGPGELGDAGDELGLEEPHVRRHGRFVACHHQGLAVDRQRPRAPGHRLPDDVAPTFEHHLDPRAARGAEPSQDPIERVRQPRRWRRGTGEGLPTHGDSQPSGDTPGATSPALAATVKQPAARNAMRFMDCLTG